jgi:hypothetical protein
MIVKTGRVVVKDSPQTDTTVAIPTSQLYNASGVPQGAPYGGGNLTVKSKSEKIVYTTKRKTERFLPNFCDHVRYQKYYGGIAGAVIKRRAADPHCSDGWYHDYTGMATAGLTRHALVESTALAQLGLSNMNLDFFGNPQTIMDATFDKLRPDLTKLSLPNFLLELDDVSKLFKQFKRTLTLLRNSAAALKSVNSTAKELAGAKLAWSFGIKPLMGDLSAMMNILRELQAKLHDFEKQANKILNFDLTYENVVITKTGSINYGGSPLSPTPWYCVYTRKTTVGAIQRCKPLSVTGEYEKMIRFYLDVLGVELNPRIIWDAIPFTFVLDWFFDVGSWLERHKFDTLELPVEFLAGFIQQTQDITISSQAIQNPSNLCSDSGIATSGSWLTHKKRFIRLPVNPTESAFRGFGWTLPTLNQAELLISLATVLK